MYGLDPDIIRNLKAIFSKFKAVDKVILYGSRAMGTYRTGSDIDITLFGKNLSNQTIFSLQDEIEELNLPYSFDISIFDRIDNEDLIDHIRRVGKVFYKKKKELPKGWEVKRLSELFLIKPPKKLAKEKLSDDALVSFVPMEDLNISNKYLSLSKQKKLSEVYRSYTYFENDDVLLAKITPCFENGKLGIAKNLINGIGFGSSEFLVFRNKGKIIPEYLYHYFSQKSFKKKGENNMSGAVGHKRVNMEFISDYLLPFPSIVEQKRIVSILDKALNSIEKAKENAEKNLNNAKELFDSYLNKIFEEGKKKAENGLWEKRSLKDLSSKIGSGATPKGGKKSYKKNGISLIRSLNVHDLKFKEDKLAFIDNYQAEKLNNVTLEEDDILLNITGASIARCCIVPKHVLPARVNQHVSIIRLKKDVFSPTFFNYLLVAKINKDFLITTGEKKGATRQALTKEILENLTICFPDLDEQCTLAKKIDFFLKETKKLQKLYQKKLQALNELKETILQKAFEGEL